ncbi:MAG TPA: hypothetical protein VLX31_11710 [Streptosporangiaceae bacterium]|nr:hypothetical protein [Streptosporangiaceae bacterium]
MSPADRNMMIESFLSAMVLLLALTLVAIARTPPMTASTVGSAGPDQPAGSGLAGPGLAGYEPAGSGPAGPEAGGPGLAGSGMADPRVAGPRPVARHDGPVAAARRTSGRYVPRHSYGSITRPYTRSGPPWEPAESPPTMTPTS